MPPLFQHYMRRSQNIPLPPRYTPFSTTTCDTPSIYPSLPDYASPFPQVDPTLPKFGPPSLPEYTLFSTTISDAPGIYSSLPEYISLVYDYIYMWRFLQNLHLFLRICPLFHLQESIAFYQKITFFHYYMRRLPDSTPPSENIPPPLSTILFDPPSIYASLPEYTLYFYNYMRRSHNLPLHPKIYPRFHNYMRHSQYLTLPPGIYPFLPEDTPHLYNYAMPPESTPPPQNIPLPFKHLYAILPKSTPSS